MTWLLSVTLLNLKNKPNEIVQFRCFRVQTQIAFDKQKQFTTISFKWIHEKHFDEAHVGRPSTKAPLECHQKAFHESFIFGIEREFSSTQAIYGRTIDPKVSLLMEIVSEEKRKIRKTPLRHEKSSGKLNFYWVSRRSFFRDESLQEGQGECDER